jgi:hypothetical protein
MLITFFAVFSKLAFTQMPISRVDEYTAIFVNAKKCSIVTGKSIERVANIFCGGSDKTILQTTGSVKTAQFGHWGSENHNREDVNKWT